VSEVPVGRYLAEAEGEPSVLLARRGEAYPWAPLRPNEQVMTAQSLLSLPGYRSQVLLQNKVQLTLWGNVPQFCGVPPLLLESVAMLRAPEAGMDLDLTLEWGRVKIANRKEQGPARVRLRTQREIWELTLPTSDSEVCAELWAALPAAGAQRPETPLTLGLFTKGRVTLQRTGAHDQKFDLADHSRVGWINTPNAPLFREQMPGLPGWWAKGPDVNDERVAEVMLALQDWAKRLSGAGELVQTIQEAVKASGDPGFREEGMFFLAALGEESFLVNYLDDQHHARLRRAAAHALRCWLSRGGSRASELVALLKVKVNSSQEATLIMDLLHPFAKEDVQRPETYQKLIGLLDDSSLAVRELACWQLEELAPEESAKLAFNPAEGSEQRRQVVASWQKLLPPGSLPHRPMP
jgi:hypothetical protein